MARINVVVVVVVALGSKETSMVRIDVDDSHPVGLAFAGVALMSAGPSLDPQKVISEIKVYDRRRERFLDNERSLHEEGIQDGELLVATDIKDRSIINAAVQP